MHPVLFKTPFVTVYSYGVCVAVALAVSIGLAYRLSARRGLSAAASVDVLFVVFVSGFAGARLFYAAQHWDTFHSDPLSFFRIQEGGLVWYGGFLSGLFFGSVYALWKRSPVLRYLDFFSPVLALAHAIGRVGCFLNGCCGGRHHPVQLYESAALALLAFFLFRMDPCSARPGRIFARYVFAYAALRFALEFLREGQPVFAGLTPPQWISLVLAASALFFLKGRREDPV